MNDLKNLARLLTGIRLAEADVLVQENALLRSLLSAAPDSLDQEWIAMQREHDRAEGAV